MGSLSFRKQDILWTWLSSVIYGVYAVMFAGCVYILMSRLTDKVEDVVNKRLLVVMILLFVSSTVTIVLDVVVELLTVDVEACSDTGSEACPLQKTMAILQAVIVPFLLFNILIGDGLWLWRCYMVWQARLKVVIFSCFLYLVTIVCFGCSFGFYLYFSVAHSEDLELDTPPLLITLAGLAVLLFYVISLINVGILTCLISWRIISVNGGLRRHLNVDRGRRYQRIAILIIESGVMYTVCTVGIFALSFLQDGTGLGLFPNLVAGMCPTALVALIALDKVLNPTTMEIRDIEVDGLGASLPLLPFVPPVLGDNVMIESADADLDAYYEEQYVEQQDVPEAKIQVEKQSVGVQTGIPVSAEMEMQQVRLHHYSV